MVCSYVRASRPRFHRRLYLEAPLRAIYQRRSAARAALVVLRARPACRACTLDATGRAVAAADLRRFARAIPRWLVSVGTGFLLDLAEQTAGICSAAVARRGGAVRHRGGCKPPGMDRSGQLRAARLFTPGCRRHPAHGAGNRNSEGRRAVTVGAAATGNRTCHRGCRVGIAEPPRCRDNAGERGRNDRDRALHLDDIPGAGSNGIGATSLAQSRR